MNSRTAGRPVPEFRHFEPEGRQQKAKHGYTNQEKPVKSMKGTIPQKHPEIGE
jgi:hypothetical protein